MKHIYYCAQARLTQGKLDELEAGGIKLTEIDLQSQAAAVRKLHELGYSWGWLSWNPPMPTKEPRMGTSAEAAAKELSWRGAPGKDLVEREAPACPPAPAPTGVVSKKHSHYYRPCPFPLVDVYRVLRLFNVTNQEIGHAVKKLLCSGLRGAKDHDKDVQEAIDTLLRHLEMNKEEREFGCANASEGP